MKIAFVSYGCFDCNSGGHMAGFANRLVERGHRVAVFADGPLNGAADFGPVRFKTIPRATLLDDPATALSFDGHAPSPADTVIHAWTPRETVRHAIAATRRAGRFRTLIHLEDDERILAASNLGRPWGDLCALPPRQLDAMMAPSLTHPHRFAAMMAAVDGVTAIARPLLSFASGPSHLLLPGCDPPAPPPSADERAALLRRLQTPANTRLIVYPGNLHPANRNEVLSLYVAVELLRRRGWPVLLVRTGLDFGDAPDVAYARLKPQVSRDLGRVSRAEVLSLIAAADILIQPGPADAFNRCRLPSKLPEFFAAGRPVILPAANLGLEVKDGVEALVSRRGDGSELADLAEQLLRNPERASSIGEAGRRFAHKRLNWSAGAEGLEGFYNRLLRVEAGVSRRAA